MWRIWWQAKNLMRRIRNGSQVVSIERHVRAGQEVSKRIWKLPSSKTKNSSGSRDRLHQVSKMCFARFLAVRKRSGKASNSKLLFCTIWKKMHALAIGRRLCAQPRLRYKYVRGWGGCSFGHWTVRSKFSDANARLDLPSDPRCVLSRWNWSPTNGAWRWLPVRLSCLFLDIQSGVEHGVVFDYPRIPSLPPKHNSVPPLVRSVAGGYACADWVSAVSPLQNCGVNWANRLPARRSGTSQS